MSIESAKAFVERVKNDEDFRKELEGQASVEERIEFAKAQGFDFTRHEIQEVNDSLSDEALDAAAVVEQNAVRPLQTICRVIRLGIDESWIEALPARRARPARQDCACPPQQTVLQYELDYGEESPIGRQSLEISLSPESFRQELAPSRTFIMQHEAEALQAQGLGRRATYKDLLVFGPDGPIDNQLRFADECVRHKLADMVGDLALAGCDFAGRFRAYRSGHRQNAELVRAVLAEEAAETKLKRCA